MSGIVARASYRFGACGRRPGTGTSSPTGPWRSSRAVPNPDARCSGRPTFVTVPRMSPPSGHALAVRRRRAETAAAARRKRRLVGLLLLATVALITLFLTAFASRGSTPLRAAATAPAPATRLLPSGPPQPQVVAMRGPLRLELPIAQDRVTAIGYHASGDGALALNPVGHQGNQGLFSRVAKKLFGSGDNGLRYYVLDGGTGPATAALDVGAAPGTDVYSPVDGTIVGITPYVLDGKPYGSRIDIQPSGNPSLVVSLTHLRARPEPDRRLVGGLDHLEDRHRPRLRGRRGAGARALHAGRGEPRRRSSVHPPPRWPTPEDSLRRGRLRRAGQGGASRSGCRAEGGARRRLLHRQRRERGRRRGRDAAPRRPAARAPAPTFSRSATTSGGGARSRPTSRARTGSSARRTSRPGSPGPRARGRRGRGRNAGRGR